jgi:long-subunit acyl-CoA synthetase (AMP-forming)
MLLTQALDRTAAERGDLPALNYKRDGRWHTINWREYRARIHLAARALIALGVAPGEHVTIIGFNCPEWFIADVAAIAAGAIPAGIYSTNTAEQCQYVAAHCDARVAFVDDEEQLAKFLAVRSALPSLRAIVLMHGSTTQPGVLSWDEFLVRGADVDSRQLEARIAAQDPDDVCTLIYTSGTTGVPKAVMLSHRNLTWLIGAAGAHVDVRPGDVVISYLPLSHIAEQCFSLIGNIVLGTWVWFAESLDSVPETLRDARPHHFLAVPRVWEKMQSRMEAVGAKSSAIKKRISRWARSIGSESNYALQNGQPGPAMYGLARRLVFSKVRTALGLDRARTLITGAAPISRSTLDFFLSLDLPILEVYGMSECTAITTISTPHRYRTGKAGWVLPGTEVRVAPDGEICIRGPNVFRGYYKDPLETLGTIDNDGWLHSGDIGEIDAEGYVQITDRKKEIIITSGGENIPPALVEGHIKSIDGVTQAVVVGDRRHYLSVLLTLDPEKIPTLASIAGSPARTLQEAAECARFSAHLQREIDAVNQRLARVQTVKRFAILPEELSIDGGELTPTMKVKRKAVHEKYAALIERLYHEEQG